MNSKRKFYDLFRIAFNSVDNLIAQHKEYTQAFFNFSLLLSEYEKIAIMVFNINYQKIEQRWKRENARSRK